MKERFHQRCRILRIPPEPQHNQVHSEFLALILGISGCLAFLIILTSRRDELKSLSRDLRDRYMRKNQERLAAKHTWETIQKIELCESPERIWGTLREASRALGSDRMVITCRHAGRTVLHHASDESRDEAVRGGPMASPYKAGRLPFLLR